MHRLIICLVLVAAIGSIGCELIADFGPAELGLTEAADLAALAEIEGLSTATVAETALTLRGGITSFMAEVEARGGAIELFTEGLRQDRPTILGAPAPCPAVPKTLLDERLEMRYGLAHNSPPMYALQVVPCREHPACGPGRLRRRHMSPVRE